MARPSIVPRRGSWSDWPDWPEFHLFGDWLRTFGGETMRIEEYREDDHLVVRAEIPGIDPEKDVDISVSEGALHIAAVRKESEREETKAGFRSEFRYGEFSRTVPLPAGASEKDVTATYVDGVLEVKVPIATTAPETRKVPVQRG